MTDELKPVRCGCGGKAQVVFPFGNIDMYLIECDECGICTSSYNTEAEAITAWNKAMSWSAEKSSVVERTAKVEQQRTCWEDIRPYKEGMCASCGRNVYDHAKYCDECGARLEWE